MTYDPKKGEVVDIYEPGVLYGSSPVYVVTGNTKTYYECAAPDGRTVYKPVEALTRSRHAKLFVSQANHNLAAARETMEAATAFLELVSHHDRNTSTTSVGASSTTVGSTN
jgi:hypothetical protein